MKVVQAPPPLIDEIDAVFKVRGKPVLFAWGDKIYNPAGIAVPPELMAHEAVHGDRQLKFEGGVEAWWRRYLIDVEFRLVEELLAHTAEFMSLCNQHRHRWVSERNMRRTYAAHVARRIAAPLYGNMIGIGEAKRAILATV